MGDGGIKAHDWEVLHIYDKLVSFIVILKSCAAREMGMTLTHDVARGLLCSHHWAMSAQTNNDSQKKAEGMGNRQM